MADGVRPVLVAGAAPIDCAGETSYAPEDERAEFAPGIGCVSLSNKSARGGAESAGEELRLAPVSLPIGVVSPRLIPLLFSPPPGNGDARSPVPVPDEFVVAAAPEFGWLGD
jgi:hypothetical protein